MKILRKIFIGWDCARYENGERGAYSIKDYHPTWDKDFKLLETLDMEFDVPEVDARGLMVESLKCKKDAVIQEATAKAEAIEEKIQQLLALPQPAAT